MTALLSRLRRQVAQNAKRAGAESAWWQVLDHLHRATVRIEQAARQDAGEE